LSYEKKDKEGATRTTLSAGDQLDVTIRAADGDGIAGTEANRPLQTHDYSRLLCHQPKGPSLQWPDNTRV
jgi:hypothetical protein